MVNFVDIIKRVRELRNLSSDKEFAEKLGLSAPDFSKRKKTGTLLPLIVDWGINERVNLDWLLTGNGHPYKKDEQQIEEIEPATPPTPNNAIEFKHMEVVKTFKNKELAKELSIILKEIEDLDSDHLREVKGILRSELSMLRLTSQSYTGEDRRKVQRRTADTNVMPGGIERRSGEDRRKASGGDH